MSHIEIAHGLSKDQATAFEARLRAARITYLREESVQAERDPFAAGAKKSPPPAPCVRFRVRRSSATAARAILHEMLEEAYAASV